MTVERSRTLTVLLAIPEEQRFHELVDGEIIRQADPSVEHGGSQAGVVTGFNGHFGAHFPAVIPAAAQQDTVDTTASGCPISATGGT